MHLSDFKGCKSGFPIGKLNRAAVLKSERRGMNWLKVFLPEELNVMVTCNEVLKLVSTVLSIIF